jgi:hypothetical protein
LLRVVRDAGFVVSLQIRAQNILAVHRGYDVWSGRAVATGHNCQDGSAPQNYYGATAREREKRFNLQPGFSLRG